MIYVPSNFSPEKSVIFHLTFMFYIQSQIIVNMYSYDFKNLLSNAYVSYPFKTLFRFPFDTPYPQLSRISIQSEARNANNGGKPCYWVSLLCPLY